MEKLTVIPHEMVREAEQIKRIIDEGNSVIIIKRRRTGQNLVQQLVTTIDIEHETVKDATDSDV